MSFNKKLVALILLILLFIFLINFQTSIESFVSECRSVILLNDSKDKTGYFTIVNSDDNNEDSYDLDYEGPKCLSTCILEHGVNPNFKNYLGTSDIFEWHRQKENIGKGYCFNANDNEFPFKCIGDNCQNKCETDKNNLDDEYFPEEDFTRCIKNDQYGCIENPEKNLNFISGPSALTTTGCKECINKYMPNLESMFKLFENEFNNKKEGCLIE
jgi:hypothetical protein